MRQLGIAHTQYTSCRRHLWFKEATEQTRKQMSGRKSKKEDRDEKMKKGRRRQRGRETTRKIYWKRDRSSFQSRNVCFNS